MKVQELQELLDFIAKSGLAEVNIETDQFKISVRRQAEALPHTSALLQNPTAPLALPASVPTSLPSQAKEEASPSPSTAKLVEVKSPMIGTFYQSPNPDSPAFVNIGDHIKAGQVVCIIEAMKLFNEIESEVSGKVVKCFVENASPVEYDQPLFLVELD
ncbi:MAG: acetyl-CoA carboxylase biotin carboxyl carrier protein [Microscillaceae bacterium]|nr:acetyl-CoA carboxylase biotin carboxyl carrier protein [Microscillaceae bacterium]